MSRSMMFMNMIAFRLPIWFRAHWFFPVAAVVAAGDVTAAFLDRDYAAGLVEAAVLFDLAVVIPAMYWFCYRARGRQTAFRAIAIACLGFWVTGKLIAPEHQFLVQLLWPVRYVGLAVLVCVELWLLFNFYRAIFKAGNAAEEAAVKFSSELGLPAWAAKIVALEATFWRKLWRLVKRVF